MAELRQILNENGKQIRMSELKIDDVFTMYEDDIKLGPYTATSEPYYHNGVWSINVLLPNESKI